MGPFAKAIWGVLYYADESEERRSNALPPGSKETAKKNPMGHFTNCFLLFRGTVFKTAQINRWKREINSSIGTSLPGYTSTYKSLTTALKYSKCAEELTAGTPVLFVFIMQGYTGLDAFRVDDVKYTPFPDEDEYLLKQSLVVRVLRVEHDFVIRNKHKNLGASFYEKPITIIYLFH